MRTTLDIDDDVLAAAKELAVYDGSTAGRVLSDLARKGLSARSRSARKTRNGFELLESHGQIVTTEMVRRLIEETE